MTKPKILIKYGGNAMTNSQLQMDICRNVAQLTQKGFAPIVVHGGGPFINAALEKANIKSEFIEGHRYTSAQAMVEIEKTLIGEVNASLVSSFLAAGAKPVGLSGKSGRTVIARKRTHQSKDGNISDLGQVGDADSVNTELIELLSQNDFIPVFSCVATDEEGNSYNVNADMLAGSIAAAVAAEAYIVLTDVDGLYRNFPDPDSIIKELSLKEMTELYGNVISGGMIPKMESCEIALNGGAKSAVILNGTKPEQLVQYFEQGTLKPGTRIFKN